MTCGLDKLAALMDLSLKRFRENMLGFLPTTHRRRSLLNFMQQSAGEVKAK
jgi:hypothetical protein